MRLGSVILIMVMSAAALCPSSADGVPEAPCPAGPVIENITRHWDTHTRAAPGSEGEGLTCSFRQKWMSPDGLTMWCVFAVWGDGAKVGVKAHDCFNLVKTTLTLRR